MNTREITVKSTFGVTTPCLLNSVSSSRYNVSEVTQQVGFSKHLGELNTGLVWLEEDPSVFIIPDVQ